MSTLAFLNPIPAIHFCLQVSLLRLTPLEYEAVEWVCWDLMHLQQLPFLGGDVPPGCPGALSLDHSPSYSLHKGSAYIPYLRA